MRISMPFINPRQRLVYTIYLGQVLAAVGLVVYWDPVWLLATLVGTFLFFSIGLECYMHRYLAHGSFKVSRPAEVAMAILSIFALQGNPLMWAAYHITHHKNSDRHGDPHPASMGWRSWWWVGTYSAADVNMPTVRRLMRDKVLVWIHGHYLRVYWGTVLIAALLDVRLAIYFFLLPAAWCFHGAGFVTVVLHRHGYRNFDTPDTSTNAKWAALFVGSPFHNNHHANPGRYNDAIRKGEIDPHGLLIHHLLRKL